MLIWQDSSFRAIMKLRERGLRGDSARSIGIDREVTPK